MTQKEKKEFMDWAIYEVNLAAEKVDCHTEDVMRQAYHLLNEYLDTTDDNGYSKAFDIFEFLLKGLPLTPLEDRDGDWLDTVRADIFVHKRRSCLYKKVFKDHVIFVDDLRFRFINALTEGKYDSVIVEYFMDQAMPIQFPYIPYENPIRVYGVEFEYMGTIYTRIDSASTPYGLKKIDVNLKRNKDNQIMKISQEEFMNNYRQYDEAMEDAQNA